MKLLALDTSTDACSVALSLNGKLTIDHRIAPQKHAQLLLPMIDKLLIDSGITAADLDGVAFGCGPGSFTGVRIAAAAAQGLAFGVDIGVIPVSSLQALAQGAYRSHSATHVFATFDARMGEVYWGAYAISADASKAPDKIVQPLHADRVCSPQQVSVPNNGQNQRWSLIGSGADQYQDELSAALGANVSINVVNDCWPSAQDVLSVATPVAQAGGFKSAEQALPIYIRDKVALTEAQRAAGEQL